MSGHELQLLEGVYAVWQLPEGADPPNPQSADFLSYTQTPEERSVVALEASAPAGVALEPGWRCLEIAGPLEFEMTGVLASIAAPLAGAGVPIFVVSTFNTDYVLVKEKDLDTAISALGGAGHTVLRG